MKDLLDLLIYKGSWITSGNDVQYKMDKINDVLYISFQWTESKTDWKQNFKFWVKPYRDMPDLWFAHKGFIENYKSVREEIWNKINELNPIQVCILGYSHGAALATLCYEDIKYNSPLITLYGFVFGSPRVVWLPSRKIKERFSNLYNMQVRGDIVTKLPFNILGYFHVGYILKAGKFRLLNRVKYHMIDQYYNLFGEKDSTL